MPSNVSLLTGSGTAAGATTATAAGKAEYKKVRDAAFRSPAWKKTKEDMNKPGTKCRSCGKAVPQVKIAPDHVAPFARLFNASKGRLSRAELIALHNDRSNLIPLCHGKGGCNNKRADYSYRFSVNDGKIPMDLAKAINLDKAANAFFKAFKSGFP
ncbi:MAG: hypothetical protein KC592_17705 [Nitrospira sp.]|nr:hypothetical protein [Nitrospira sp.]